MALIACPECAQQVSSLAAACPKCAAPIAQRDSARACWKCKGQVSTTAPTCPHCGAFFSKVPPQAEHKKPGPRLLIVVIGVCAIALALALLFEDRSPSPDVPAKTAARPAVDTRESSKPALEVQSWHCTQEHGYTFVRGEVKNVSSTKLENILAVGEFRSSGGDLVKSEDALLDYNPIMPGQTSPFSAGGTDNPEIEKCNLAFKYLGGSTIAYRNKPPPPRSGPARRSGMGICYDRSYESWEGMVGYTEFPSLESCLASGGRAR